MAKTREQIMSCEWNRKLKDVEFIKEARGIACNAKEEGQNRYKEIRNIYNKIYGYSCNNYCYYAIME